MILKSFAFRSLVVMVEVDGLIRGEMIVPWRRSRRSEAAARARGSRYNRGQPGRMVTSTDAAHDAFVREEAAGARLSPASVKRIT